ncbi:GNAT family N-acetyltransferase [Deinococcus altitudinis]|uniref:GNAT family N-acetyltransferase n=1 Tax=Deinococcus altitudinis TaxID=468914 RepID=UPI003891FD03
MNLSVRPLVAADYRQARPMLIDMGFVDDEAALAERYPAFCARPDYALLGAFEGETLLGYAGLHDYGPHLRAGNTHRTAKLDDLYTLPTVRRRGVGRALMQAAEAWGKARGLRYLFWYANLREATPAYVGMGYVAGEEVQEGYRFFEIDFGEANTRQPHPERGS